MPIQWRVRNVSNHILIGKNAANRSKNHLGILSIQSDSVLNFDAESIHLYNYTIGINFYVT